MKWNRIFVVISTVFLTFVFMLTISGTVRATLTSPKTTASTEHALYLPWIAAEAGTPPQSLPLPPSIVTQPSHATITAPLSLTLTAEAEGDGPLFYQWRRNGQNISGANSSSYTLHATMPADHGAEFDVVITNTYGTVISQKAVLTVTNSMPPTAVNDAYTTTLGGILVQPAPGVLANDAGDNLQAIPVEGVLNGSLTLNSDGSFTYQHSGLPFVELELEPGSSNPSFEYGVATAIDGDTLVVGSNSNENGLYAGTAYVFVRNGVNWQLEAKLFPNDPEAIQFFGWAVDISGDTIVVGAPGDSQLNLQYAGAAYVFVRNNEGQWVQQAKLTANDGAARDEFGGSVAIDGDTVVAGAYFNEHAGFDRAGAAYVFVRSSESWSQQAKLVAGDPEVNASLGLGLSIDGDMVAVGALFKNENSFINAGAVYIFTRSGSNWSQSAKLVAGDASANQTFGFTTAIQNNTLVVGANGYMNTNNITGAAYIFEYDGNDWQETEKLTAPNETNDGLFRYGISVAIDGDNLLVGSHDTGPTPNAGAVYHYTYSNNNWTQPSKILSLNYDPEEEFGTHVAIDGNYVTVGANSEKFHPIRPDDEDGTAYVYQIGGNLTDSFTYAAYDGVNPPSLATVFIYLGSPTGTPIGD